MQAEEIEVTEVGMNNMQIYQQDKALIDMQIATAKQYPRNLKKAIENAIAIVSLDAETADSCFYTLKKGKVITGPSVHLARILAQQMGNMRVENRVVGFDSTHVTCEAVCFDLERNFAVRTQIRKSIIGSNGRYSEDMQVITANACNAVAYRNAVFSVIDAAIVKKVMSAAKNVIAGDVSTEASLLARRKKVFDGFKENYHQLNLTDEDICKAIGKNSVAHINADDIISLIGLENSIKGGEQTPEEIFRPQINRENPVPKDKSGERLILLINSAKSLKELSALEKEVKSNEARLAYDEAFKKLNSK
ncbi:MAG: hypothetical protein E6Q68_07895 [Polynucleobacter sp.]|nr:MAG: hypothetical protein E6Q68_07895 [Polynucleobacter sp.]